MSNMNIYLLKRILPQEPDYDVNDGKIVLAKSAARARFLANLSVADEGKIWQDPEKTTCCNVFKKFPNEEGVVLTDFHAG